MEGVHPWDGGAWGVVAGNMKQAYRPALELREQLKQTPYFVSPAKPLTPSTITSRIPDDPEELPKPCRGGVGGATGEKEYTNPQLTQELASGIARFSKH